MNLDVRSLKVLPPERVAGCIASLVEGLVSVNLAFLDAFPDTPELYRSMIRYAVSPVWCDIPALLILGQGDCKSLAAWRIAELRRAKKLALVHVVMTDGEPGPKGLDLYHVQVRRDEKHIEDPSVVLGMK